jgi:hypothetical protein
LRLFATGLELNGSFGMDTSSLRILHFHVELGDTEVSIGVFFIPKSNPVLTQCFFELACLSVKIRQFQASLDPMRLQIQTALELFDSFIELS